MPGAIPHIIAAAIIFFMVKHRYRDHFTGRDGTREQYLLLGVTMFCSFLPDLPLSLYYLGPVEEFETIYPYHYIFQTILVPISLILLLLLSKWKDVVRRPIWIAGTWCILLHIIMDAFIPEAGFLI